MGALTNWGDENDNVDEEPVGDHGDGTTHVPHLLRVNLGRITERDREER